MDDPGGGAPVRNGRNSGSDRNGRGAGPAPRRWPDGHVGWAFDGPAHFEGAVTTFLAEGGARHERLMYIADEPRPALWPRHLLDRGVLVLASTAEVYGPDRTVDADAQRRTFEDTLAEARRDGYSGIRVAADNTSLTIGAERLEAWLRWEEVAERFMAENPVTGLCAFDRTRTGPELIRVLMDAHRRQPSRTTGGSF